MTEYAAEYDEPRFLDDRLAHWAAAKPDDEAITYLGRTWTWSGWRRVRGAACRRRTTQSRPRGGPRRRVPGDVLLGQDGSPEGGRTSYVLFGIHDGVPSVMTRDPDAASLAGAITQGANRTFLVPAVLAQVLQSGDDAVRLFCNLKTYCYGAAPMPMPLLRAAIKAWPDTDFIQVYGLTEVSGVITHLMPEALRDEEHPERLVSAGQCVPDAEVKVVAPDTGEEVAAGAHGELWFVRHS